MAAMKRPLIGITTDRREDNRYECGAAYSRAVVEAGGVPVMLPQVVALAAHYAAMCDGLLLTGGIDPDVRAFGDELHPEARVVHPERQAFETALLEAADAMKPTLGVCLGMQMMALTGGGKLNQYMPDTMANPEAHQADARHPVILKVIDSAMGAETCDVASYHRQCVAAPGRLRIVATAEDGVIEAIDDPRKSFYLGVQWHPERGGDGPLNQGLIERFVRAAEKGNHEGTK